MNALSIIITLVSVIAGVLQIILFFKIWGMCNDIKAMRQVQAPEVEAKKDEVADSSMSWMIMIAVIAVVILVFCLMQ